MDEPPRRPPVLALPRDKRLAIVVVADGKEKPGSGAGSAAIVGGVLGALVGGPVGAAVGAGLGVVKSLPKEGVWRARQDEVLNLHFPPGHPRVGESYGLHPFIDDYYIPLGSYHRLLREAKQAELLRIAAALGATRVRATMTQEAHRSSKGGASAATSGGSGELNAQHREIAAHRITLDETYEPSEAPHLPSEGLVWLPHEPTWRGLVERRLQYGTLTATARLEYLDDYGVDAGLAARVGQHGGKVGGGFKAIETVSWDVEITFAKPI